MWNRKQSRIADLEARNAYLNKQLETARGNSPASDTDPAVRQLRTLLTDTRQELRRTEDQLGLSRRAAMERADLLEKHRLTLSTALGLGTAAPWDIVIVRAQELAGQPAEAAS